MHAPSNCEAVLSSYCLYRCFVSGVILETIT
jgi:hypothetical protein